MGEGRKTWSGRRIKDGDLMCTLHKLVYLVVKWYCTPYLGGLDWPAASAPAGRHQCQKGCVPRVGATTWATYPSVQADWPFASPCANANLVPPDRPTPMFAFVVSDMNCDGATLTNGKHCGSVADWRCLHNPVRSLAVRFTRGGDPEVGGHM